MKDLIILLLIVFIAYCYFTESSVTQLINEGMVNLENALVQADKEISSEDVPID